MIRSLVDLLVTPRNLGLMLALAGGGVAQAEIVAVPSEIDLGRRRQEQVVQSEVTLTNTGSTVAKIVRVGADCSCTAATPDRTTLAPGESTKMKVSFETRNNQGEVHRRITVLTSEGEFAIPLKAVVSVYDDWTYSSATAMLPPTNKGQATSGNFIVTFNGPGKAEITGFSSEAEWLHAAIVEHRDNVWTIGLTKAADAPAGNLQPKLIAHTTDRHEPELSIDVFEAVYSVLLVQPNPILLPVGKVGQRTMLPLTIAGWEPTPDPRGEIANGKLTVQKRDHRDVLLTLEVTPDKVGTSTRLLHIYAGKGLEAEVPVIVRAEQP